MNVDPSPAHSDEESAFSPDRPGEYDEFSRVSLPSQTPQVDYERLMSLTNDLERDVALIEGAMVHLETREFASVNAAIDVLDGNTTA